MDAESKRETRRLWAENNREHLREYARAYYAKNKTKIAVQMHESHLRNRTSRLAAHKKYLSANRDKMNTYWKQWRLDNKERFAQTSRKSVLLRRSRLSGAAGNFDYLKFLQRVAFFGWRCRYCSIGLTPKTVTCDHQIPLSRGGSNWPANLVPACASCNKRKNAKTPMEYMLHIMEAAPPLISSTTGLNVPNP
jgi:5-methylcytosine-specific restriction endonuclease McrA